MSNKSLSILAFLHSTLTYQPFNFKQHYSGTVGVKISETYIYIFFFYRKLYLGGVSPHFCHFAPAIIISISGVHYTERLDKFSSLY